MPAEPWKYEENTFLSVTKERASFMGEILRDHVPKLEAAAASIALFTPPAGQSVLFLEQWNGAETAVTNAEAGQRAATAALVDRLESLTRKPDLDTNSPIETWDATIRSIVAYQGTTYTYLLPDGRETLTGGRQDENVRALRDFAIRLSEQTTKPGLLALGATVLLFSTATQALADARDARKNALDDAREALETLRVQVAWQLFATTGLAMSVWAQAENTHNIGELFDLALIREPAPPFPEAPAAPLWNPATRTLSVAALPANATRLEAWRLTAGSAPELLALGEKDAVSVTVPPTITFEERTIYEFWLRGHNSRGAGPESAHVSWEAE